MGLRVVVVGAGIGGLTTSIALSRAGHKVTIFERSHFKSELGAAITLTPNASRILNGWGFDSEKAGACDGHQLALVDASTLHPLFDMSFLELKKQFGHSLQFYHRVDLHHSLKELAESSGADIRLGHTVEVVSEDGTGSLSSGESFTADMIVIADGVHSSHLPSITGKVEPLLHSGRSAIRALVQQEKIRSDPELKPVFGQKSPGWYVPCTMPPKATQFVTYPCRNNNVLNVAVVHNTLPGYEERDNWHNTMRLEDAQNAIEKFHPACHKLLTLSDAITVYALSRRNVLPKFVNNRLVVVGDAAHIMPPTHAQAAAAVIEEACALEVFLSGVTDAHEVPTRLQLYEDLVKPRMQTVQLLSQATPGQNDAFRKQAEEIWQGEGHGTLYPDETMYYGGPIRTFFYGYDIRHEAQNVLREAGVTLS